MATANERALAWAEAIRDDTRGGLELQFLNDFEGAVVDVRCRWCGSEFLRLTPAGNRAAVVPADDDHLGTRFVPDARKDSEGRDLTTFERIKLLCPCGQGKSPSITARKLAREWLYALAGRRGIEWPLR